MSSAEASGRPARPTITLSRGDLGLLVWGLGILRGNLEEESGTDLIDKELERLLERLREHCYALDDWAKPTAREEEQ